MILTHQKGRGKKIHILLDDEYQITTDIDFWAENFIPDKTDITDDEWKTLVKKINYKKAKNKCYDLLSRREHSIKDLKTKLLRTVDEESADLAINHMIDLGYLNDEKYAEKLVDYLVNTKHYSINHIKSEMFKKGLSSEVISATLNDVEIDNVQLILDLINKKYLIKLKSENGKEKVTASLMRLGFSYSDIKSAFYRMENENYV